MRLIPVLIFRTHSHEANLCGAIECPARREAEPELQRTQEVQQVLFLGCGKRVEVCNHAIGFRPTAGMISNRGKQVAGAAIMQEEAALSQSPQRSGAELITTCATLA